MKLSEPQIIELPKISDVRGNLSFIEGLKHVPFDIERIYYLYDVPGGADRGSHAHKNLEQLIIAISGSFDVLLDDGKGRHHFQLNRPFQGLYIPPMTWRYLNNFSSGSVCLVLASLQFNESDYIRNYSEFKKMVDLTK